MVMFIGQGLSQEFFKHVFGFLAEAWQRCEQRDDGNTNAVSAKQTAQGLTPELTPELTREQQALCDQANDMYERLLAHAFRP